MGDLNAAGIVRHLAGWGLPGGPTDPIDVGRLDGIAATAALERVTGVALAALEAGAVTRVSDQLVEALSVRHLELMHQSLMAEADLVRVVRILDRAGIECRALKGCATAHLDYPDPTLRSTSDADVLIRRSDLETATDALSNDVDWSRSIPDRRDGWAARYGKDRTLRLVDGGWLDLHVMVCPGYWGLVLDHSSFFDESDDLILAGTAIKSLSRRHRWLHATLHLGFSARHRVQSMRDVVVIDGPHEFPVHVLAPIIGLLQRGCAIAAAGLGCIVSAPDAVANLEPTRRERLALTTVEASHAHWSGVAILPPWQWPAYLLPIAVPGSDYLGWRKTSRSAHAINAARRLMTGRVRPASQRRQVGP